MHEEKEPTFEDIEYANIPDDLTSPEVRIDLESPLEIGLIVAGIFGIVVVIGLLADYAPDHLFYIPLAIGWTVLCFFLRYKTDCTYILDNNKQVILYRRTILGSTSETLIGSFSEVLYVTAPGEFIKTKHSSYWSYGIAIVTGKGEMVYLSNGYRDDRGLKRCNEFAEKLAAHIGATYFPGESGKGVQASFNPNQGQVTIDFADGHAFQRKRQTWVIAVVIVSVIVTTVFAVLMVTSH